MKQLNDEQFEKLKSSLTTVLEEFKFSVANKILEACKVTPVPDTIANLVKTDHGIVFLAELLIGTQASVIIRKELFNKVGFTKTSDIFNYHLHMTSESMLAENFADIMMVHKLSIFCENSDTKEEEFLTGL